jgi:hypothetical protein
MLASLALAIGLVGATTTAMAQTKQELVNKVLQLQQPGVEALGNTLANNTASQVLQMAGRAMGQVPPEKREALAKEMQADVRKFYDDVSPQLRSAAVKLAPSTLGAVYAEKFSEDELKTLITWLESPVNKKFQQSAVEMQQTLGQKLVSETKGQVEPTLKVLEQTLAAKLNAASGNAGGASAPKAGTKK